MMIDWRNCVSNARDGIESGDSNRSNFQRDYDRIIFSSAFRRLQNKTQVFPLPGNTFVHNRLTHSLEVASVGRSLGSIVGDHISKTTEVKGSDKEDFYKYDLSSVVASACLAHDLGNPPFGHSGETAISSYFVENANKKIGERNLVDYFSQKEWSDLTNFEGNANALHILTYPYTGKLENGLQLTHTTLASIMKYPCEAQAIDKTKKHRKKYGFFQLDQEKFLNIARSTNMVQENEDGVVAYKRHPFVYLVEAADDVCYRIIDFEDAHRIGIINTNDTIDLLRNTVINLHQNSSKKIEKSIDDRLRNVTDANEIISYLRAKCISELMLAASQEFILNAEEILHGQWNQTLLDKIETNSNALEQINKISIEKIYNHSSVINIEIAGYKVLSDILDTYVTALLSERKSPLQHKIMHLLPIQFRRNEKSSAYEKVMNVIDFVAGMTDGYATEIYRNFQGIEIAKHR
jgi:dGTPase